MTFISTFPKLTVSGFVNQFMKNVGLRTTTNQQIIIIGNVLQQDKGCFAVRTNGFRSLILTVTLP